MLRRRIIQTTSNYIILWSEYIIDNSNTNKQTLITRATEVSNLEYSNSITIETNVSQFPRLEF